MSFDTLQRWTIALDDAVRIWDFRQHRTDGGLLDRWFGISRHSPSALLLPAGLCALLVLASPAPTRLLLALATGAAVAVLLVLQMRLSWRRRWPLKADLAMQVLLVLATAAVVWVGRPDTYQDDGLYRHLMVPLAVVLALALAGAALLVDAMFRRLRQASAYGDYLKRTELFASRGQPPAITWGTLATAVLTVAFRAPMALLTLPALATLVAPPAWMPQVPAAVLAVCLLALIVSGLNERFGMMWTLAQQVFFQGGALLVSLLVIVLAALRIAGVSYATTVFDTAAWWTLGAAMLGAYVLSWWYDYWAHRLLADQVLQLIDPHAAGAARVPYPIDKPYTSVPGPGRRLQVHGSGRLAVVNEAADKTFFQAHSLGELVDKLATCGAPGGKAVPTPVQVSSRMSDFHVLATLLFAGTLALGAWALNRGEQSPQVRLQTPGTPGLALDALLSAPPAGAADEPLIVVAASGGGTRAAVFTAALLEGLSGLGQARQVVLGSGVSGGGAALAYFAGHRPALVAGDPKAWKDYIDRMSEPFIQDVMERSSEWRMVSSGRLGMLLGESFEQRWHLPPGRSTMDSIGDMGLILNTSLAGHLDRPPGASGGEPLHAVEPRYRSSLTRSTLAGGRLLLTNLALPPELVSQPLEPQVSHRLPVVLRSPQLTLAQAAALNANFPPVFSNAAIDVDDKTRYWVTDGGAVDNRGMEMLLYALRLQLGKLPADRLPKLHVIVADASALSDGYSQDRGVSSMAGAGSRFASHLNAELVTAIQSHYAAQPQRFKFSYVMMPDLLRESSSFGTHWMLQGTIRVRHGDDTRTIGGRDMVQVIRALHSPGAERGLSAPACRVLAWSREDQGHQRGWQAVREALGGRAPPPVACAAD
ncbi:MAG: hypothetical protein ACOZJX_19375 [Pseudomonadota bacterium]